MTNLRKVLWRQNKQVAICLEDTVGLISVLLITVLYQVRRHENEHEPVNEAWKEATESDSWDFG